MYAIPRRGMTERHYSSLAYDVSSLDWNALWSLGRISTGFMKLTSTVTIAIISF